MTLKEFVGDTHASETQQMARQFLGELPVFVRMPKALEWIFGISRGLMRTEFDKWVREQVNALPKNDDGTPRLRHSSLRAIMETGVNGVKPFGPIPLHHRKRVAMVLEFLDLVETLVGD